MMDPCREMIRLHEETFLLFHPQNFTICRVCMEKNYTRIVEQALSQKQLAAKRTQLKKNLYNKNLDAMLPDDMSTFFFDTDTILYELTGCAPKFFAEAQNIWIFLE